MSAQATYPAEQRTDDLLSLRAQIANVRQQMAALEGAVAGHSGDTDLLYLEEKAQKLSDAAAAVAHDARVIADSTGGRWLGEQLDVDEDGRVRCWWCLEPAEIRLEWPGRFHEPRPVCATHRSEAVFASALFGACTQSDVPQEVDL